MLDGNAWIPHSFCKMSTLKWLLCSADLVRKLQEAGSKDDIKVPLRVLRDEIGRLYFGSAKQRTAKIDTLFKVRHI